MAALALAMASTAVQAVNYASVVAGGLWSAPATWGAATTPGSVGLPGADIARIVNGGWVTLNSTVPIAMGNVQIGRNTGGAGNFEVTTGGILNLTAASSLLVGDQTGGTFLMSGGTINNTGRVDITASVLASGSTATINGGNLNVGLAINVGKFAFGTLAINGGSVQALKMFVGTNGINSFVNLQGGTLTLLDTLTGGLTFNTVGSTLTIANAATLTLGGDKTTAVAGFAGGNLLWATGSSTLGGLYGTGDQTFDNGFGSYLHSFYDSTPAKTYVWVDMVPVPEPATLSLALLGGIGLLVGRRVRRS